MIQAGDCQASTSKKEDRGGMGNRQTKTAFRTFYKREAEGKVDRGCFHFCGVKQHSHGTGYYPDLRGIADASRDRMGLSTPRLSEAHDGGVVAVYDIFYEGNSTVPKDFDLGTVFAEHLVTFEWVFPQRSEDSQLGVRVTQTGLSIFLAVLLPLLQVGWTYSNTNACVVNTEITHGWCCCADVHLRLLALVLRLSATMLITNLTAPP